MFLLGIEDFKEIIHIFQFFFRSPGTAATAQARPRRRTQHGRQARARSGKVPENTRSGLRSGCVLLAFCSVFAFSRSRFCVLPPCVLPLRSGGSLRSGSCVLGPLRSVSSRSCVLGCLAFWVLRSGLPCVLLAFCPCVLCLLDLAFWVAWRSGSCVLGCLAFCLRSALAFWGLAFCLRSRVLPCVLLAFSRSACVLLFCLRSGVLPCWCGRWSSDGRASTIRGCNF